MRSSFSHIAASLAVVGVVVLQAGCATYSERTAMARDAIARGDLQGGISEYNKLLEVKDSSQLPAEWNKDIPLTVLERGTALRALSDYKTSSRDYTAVDKELEYLDIARDTGGKIGKYIYSDSSGKYKSSPTEKLALNGLNLLNYLCVGDLKGARVEAKRFSVMYKYLHDFDPETSHGAFGSYLAGVTFEYLGEYDSAMRYYDEALQARDLPSLRGPITRLSKKSSYRTKRLREYIDTQSFEPQQTEPPAALGNNEQSGGATGPRYTWNEEPGAPQTPALPAKQTTHSEIVIVVNTGRVPYKMPERIPIGAAIGLAHTYVTGDTSVLERGVFKVVVYPELVAASRTFDRATMSIDGQSVSADLVSSLGSEIHTEYENLKPRIIGAAISRMIVRAVAGEGARAAGNQNSGALGLLLGLAIEGTMVALDRPDTRSWTLLPDQVYISRAQVPAGPHKVAVKLSGSSTTEVREFDVDVTEGGVLVLDVTTLR